MELLKVMAVYILGYKNWETDQGVPQDGRNNGFKIQLQNISFTKLIMQFICTNT